MSDLARVDLIFFFLPTPWFFAFTPLIPLVLSPPSLLADLSFFLFFGPLFFFSFFFSVGGIFFLL